MLMKVIDAIQAMILYAIAAVSVVIGLDALLRLLEARDDNAIVSAVRSVADRFVPEAVGTMFADQTALQTALLALLGYAVLVALVVLVFRLLRATVAALTPAPPSEPEPESRRPKAAPETQAERDAVREQMRAERERRKEEMERKSAERRSAEQQ
jgi:uncharacterized membrane protein YcfT